MDSDNEERKQDTVRLGSEPDSGSDDSDRESSDSEEGGLGRRRSRSTAQDQGHGDDADQAGATATTQSQEVCLRYLRGNCKSSGVKKCRYLHPAKRPRDNDAAGGPASKRREVNDIAGPDAQAPHTLVTTSGGAAPRTERETPQQGQPVQHEQRQVQYVPVVLDLQVKCNGYNHAGCDVADCAYDHEPTTDNQRPLDLEHARHLNTR